MAQSGHIVENPITGHKVKFLKTASETNGDLLQIEYIVPNREEPLQYIPLHIHAQTEERFKTISGRLGVIIDNKDNRSVLKPGESVVIPPGTAHTFWNAGDKELRFITDIRPAGLLQTYWETAFGLAADGQVNHKGLPNMWQLAVLSQVMDTYMPGVPIVMQKVLIGGLLGGIGHLLGYRASYKNTIHDDKQAII